MAPRAPAESARTIKFPISKPADLFNSPKDPRTKALIGRYRSNESSSNQ